MKEKERLIIEMAMKLFATKGVNATSVQEIVTACGISKGAFYLYFKSKEELLLATLRYYYDKIQNKMMDIEKSRYCHVKNLQNNCIASLTIYKSIKNSLLCMPEKMLFPLIKK